MPLLFRQALPEAIADTAYGFDQVASAELAPERLDVHVDRPFQDDGAIADGRIEQLGTCEGSSRLAQQTFEQAEFGRRQVYLAAFHQRSMAHPVDAHAQVLD